MATKSYKAFVKAIADRESSDNYACVNSLGYLGRYQFGMARLTDLGVAQRKPGHSGYANSAFDWVEGMTKEKFLSSPALQDKLFDMHVEGHRRRVMKRFKGHIGKSVKGVHITLSGMIACMHLLGEGGLRNFLSGKDKADGYGTKASDYVKLFAGYDIPEDLPRVGTVKVFKYVE